MDTIIILGIVLAIVLLVVGIIVSISDKQKIDKPAHTPMIKSTLRNYVIIGVCFVVFMITLQILNNQTKSSSPVSSLNYFNIVDNYNSYTTVQKSQYVNSLKGTHVAWYGMVDDVNHDLFWTHVWVYPTNYTQEEFRFYFDIPSWQAVNYYRGENIKVDGFISDAGYSIFRFHVKLDQVTTVETPYQIVP